MLLRSKRTVDSPLLEPSHKCLHLINHFTQIKNDEKPSYRVLFGTLFLFYAVIFLGSLQFKDSKSVYPIKQTFKPETDIIELIKIQTDINKVSLLTTQRGFMSRKKLTNIAHDFAEMEFFNKNRTTTHKFLCSHFKNSFVSIMNFKADKYLTHQFSFYCPSIKRQFDNYIDIVIFRNQTIDIEKIKVVI
jgi:hypothetical protein